MAGAAIAPVIPSLAWAAPASTLSKEDDAFLDDMQRRGLRYFWEQASPKTGQVLDRARWDNNTGKIDSRPMASIACTGFALTAFCIADKRGYMPRAQLVERVRNTLRFHVNKMENVHGFFSHFNDVELGYPYQGSEISPIDTTLLLCGVLTAREHFKSDAEIHRLATELYSRIEWPWMLNGGTTFAMGYRNNRFIDSRWDHFCELMMMVLLAIGSPTHPVEPSAWDAFTRPVMKFEDYSYISSHDPLFVHQYSHAYFDFRNKRDKYANYFENSITATKAHEAWCLSLGKPYSEDYWGISASDSANGYQAWGGPPKLGTVDGSVVPYATAGSLPFTPDACMRVQKSLKAKYGSKVYGRYGFRDAFHPDANWYDADVLGIDLGISVVMAENLRSGFVWDTFMKNPEVKIAMSKAGFRPE
ncbi:MAG: glucoamylase family protein [Acidobacteriaceae bacterium]|nr:glucoamylase family protein [Acidobacteriaceae bacterium]